MNVLSKLPKRRAACLLATMAGLLLTHGPAQAKSKIYWMPGITPWLDVFTSSPSEGHQRLYPLSGGTSTTWSAQQNQPIQQGDQIVLHVWVAPGGGDIKEVRVSLDNVSQQPDQTKQIPNANAAPGDKTWQQEWTETINTSSLAVGKHLINIWAQEIGDPRGASNRTLSFDVVKQLPTANTGTGTGTPVVAYKGSIQEMVNGVLTYVRVDSDNAAPNAQPLPTYLAGKPVDEKATVAIQYRDATDKPASPTIPVGTGLMEISHPTDFTVTPQPGSTAKTFVYTLVRDGQPILTSTQPIDFVSAVEPYAKITTLIKVQSRTADRPGMRPGHVTLWAWGLDAAGQPGQPAEVDLDLAP